MNKGEHSKKLLVDSLESLTKGFVESKFLELYEESHSKAWSALLKNIDFPDDQSMRLYISKLWKMDDGRLRNKVKILCNQSRPKRLRVPMHLSLDDHRNSASSNLSSSLKNSVPFTKRTPLASVYGQIKPVSTDDVSDSIFENQMHKLQQSDPKGSVEEIFDLLLADHLYHVRELKDQMNFSSRFSSSFQALFTEVCREIFFETEKPSDGPGVSLFMVNNASMFDLVGGEGNFADAVIRTKFYSRIICTNSKQVVEDLCMALFYVVNPIYCCWVSSVWQQNIGCIRNKVFEKLVKTKLEESLIAQLSCSDRSTITFLGGISYLLKKFSSLEFQYVYTCSHYTAFRVLSKKTFGDIEATHVNFFIRAWALDIFGLKKAACAQWRCIESCIVGRSLKDVVKDPARLGSLAQPGLYYSPDLLKTDL